jgi:predicted negative regulator of RcsB-dependent stress response
MSAPTVQQALALYKHAYEQGQLAEAEGYLRQALAITREEQGDRQSEKEILINLGLVAKE